MSARVAALVVVFGIAGQSAFAGAVLVNGVCQVGNCASPDIIAMGTSVTTSFNFTYTFPNTDTYLISGSLIGTFGQGILVPFNVIYVGNASRTTSGTDVLTIDFLLNFQSAFTSAGFNELLTGGFGGPISPASSVQGRVTVSGRALPLQGPFSPPADFSVSVENQAVSGITNPLRYDEQRTFTFGAGSGAGAEILNHQGSAGPGPGGSRVTCAAGGVASNCNAFVCTGDSVASGGSCSSVAFDGSTSGSSVLVFEGSGSGSSVLSFEGSSGRSSILTFDGPGTSGSSVLTFDGSGTGAGISLKAATSAPAAIEIALPAQSVTASYSATASCSKGPAACWISLPTPTGTIPARARAAITAVVNSQGLNAGVYSAIVAVTITPTGGKASMRNVPVSILITPSEPALTLSQTGLQLQGALPQTISVLNTGTGPLSFSASASTLTGGNWLTASPSSNTAPTQVKIQANPSGLAPGLYYGRVEFTAAGVLNAPQSVEVALTVSPTGPVISPAALVFTGSNPGAQTVQVSSTSTVTTQPSFAKGNGWFSASGSSPVTVSVNTAGLAPGVYLGTLNIHLAENNSDHPVTVMLVVPKSSCTATQLLPVFTNLPGGFTMTAGLPAPLQAQVVDDCGNPLDSGGVVAYFGGRDTPVSLVALGSGQWSGTWMPHQLAGGAASAGLIATGFAPTLYGSSGVTGTLAANPNAPLISSGGAVSAASLAANAPLAPGSYISIFGANLARGSAQANTLPLPQNLSGTQVLLGGEPLPLQFAGAGQINAIVPYDVPVNTFLQLIVEQNGVESVPENVLVAQAQPAVFTQDQSGKGAGVIVVVKPDGTQFEATAPRAATAGDALVIYSTGLGAVMPAVPAGSASPASTLSSTSSPVTVSIGGNTVQPFFAGLAPGFAGLYQVNVIVPGGITPGANVPVVLSIAGAFSPAVTVAIQ